MFTNKVMDPISPLMGNVEVEIRVFAIPNFGRDDVRRRLIAVLAEDPKFIVWVEQGTIYYIRVPA